MNMELDRTRMSFAGSLLFHLILFFIIAYTGSFTAHRITGGITEVAIVASGIGPGGGGGGGGGGGSPGEKISEDVIKAEAALLAAEKAAKALEAGPITNMEELTKAPPVADPDAISEKSKADTPAPATMTAAAASVLNAKLAEDKIDTSAATGVKGGGGIGTGIGSGTGSGVGAGSGSGTGGGVGSGVGTGTGSGVGAGSGSGTGGGHGAGVGTGIGDGVGDGISFNPAVPPRVVSSVAPVYPEAQRSANITGTVMLRLLIGTDGSVESVTLLRTSGSEALDSSAIRACHNWRFSSAKNGAGQKIRCYWDIPVRFNLTR